MEGLLCGMKSIACKKKTTLKSIIYIAVKYLKASECQVCGYPRKLHSAPLASIM